MPNGLSIQHFFSGYPFKNVIDNLSLPVLPKGNIIALLGPNGCGKSTLLRGIAGLNRVKGEVVLDDKNLMHLSFSERSKSIVYLPQSLPAGIHLHVFESILVAQNVNNPNSRHRNEQHDVIMNLLQRLGIEHLAFHHLDQLSGGQKQLVGLAQSLVRHPQVLLLDEPLSALDLNYQLHVMEMIKQETQRYNMVTMVVLHDVNIALHHADYVVMLKEGKMVAYGKPLDVINRENLADVYGVNTRIELCSQKKSHVLVDSLIVEHLHY